MRILFRTLLLLTSLCWFPSYAQNVTVIGIGRLGICFALCLEKAGYEVLGVDVSEDYVSQINAKTLVSSEPFVSEYLQKSQHLRATTSLKEGMEFSDICFILVPTNSVPGLKSYDHDIISHVLSEINALKVSDKHIVISSTIFPGYIRETARPLLQDCPRTTVSYNPEFIAQGAVIAGLLNPDLVLIGEGSPETGSVLEEIYTRVCTHPPRIARMSVDSAEIAKLALNCFVTAKIAFANLIGDIADSTPNADKFAILQAIGQDQRIGTKCLLPGYGFGGPCFPRDNRALGNYALLQGIEPLFFVSTDKTNQQHALYQAAQLLASDQASYLFEDVCYKPKCPVPIIEESQKLEIAKLLATQGKRVIIRDRQDVIEQVKKLYADLFEYEVLTSE